MMPVLDGWEATRRIKAAPTQRRRSAELPARAAWAALRLLADVAFLFIEFRWGRTMELGRSGRTMMMMGAAAGRSSLPEIKSGRIDGVGLRDAGRPRCGQPPELHATLVHPCSPIGACAPHCNIVGTIPATGAGAAR